MAHHIHGFIAKFEPLCHAARRLPNDRVLRLPLGFGFLPITEEIGGEAEPVPFDFLNRLTVRLSAWAENESVFFSLAYIETDYFGGIGTQAAIVWKSGRVAFGPQQSKSEWVEQRLISPPLLENAINRALRLIGVDRGTVVDEFEALDLGRHRSDERWLFGTSGK
ncbi:MAG: hypothetical protein HY040_20845 [Planctomycetes bacterium]|nr:hypothetical protein [Planctomycetota bacterium]